MGWTLTDDAEEFAAGAETFLREDPIGNTVLLTVLGSLRTSGRDGPAVKFGWWSEGAGTGGAFVLTGTRPLLLSALAVRAARELAEELRSRGVSLTAVNAGEPTAEGFADAWARRTGATATVRRRMSLYRLDRLRHPDPMPRGAARVAYGPDRGLLIDWYAAFTADTGEPGGPASAAIDDKLGYGGLLLWEVDGTSVAMAGRTRAAAGVARVAPVYTPARWRRRGYGAAVTAAVTASALRDGANDVVLFADAANTTSNGVYRRLGYRAARTWSIVAFT
ncbi:GNAT family N-acetyltransferase [Actinomadura graeca]|uniref:GNAT family N-acetyltransferase n=1 Tax=Actinomadura graeca TaxID=2750812 RepID=A0ABX8R321_9ACTN|nr:GNAT family N-acetyltransferase [Actinomadura graeca]QXJ25476.1 GNAT family N-acetyltransferase [Actinomadura graeca]